MPLFNLWIDNIIFRAESQYTLAINVSLSTQIQGWLLIKIIEAKSILHMQGKHIAWYIFKE